MTTQCQGWRIVSLMVLMAQPEAIARDQYLQEFRSKYGKNFTGNDEAAQCTVCHPGLIKRTRNTYGQAVGKLLSGRNVKDAEKIREALTKAEKEPSDTKGKSFGDLIRDGVLPGKKESP